MTGKSVIKVRINPARLGFVGALIGRSYDTVIDCGEKYQMSRGLISE